MKHDSIPPRRPWRLLPALILAFLAVPAVAGHDRAGVTLFEDVHFRGQYETFDGDVPSLEETYFGNDRATSITVPPGCRVTLYRDAGFRGPSATLDHDVADLRGTWVGNDEASSLRVDCYGSRRGRPRGGYGDDRRGRFDDDRDGGYGDGGYGDARHGSDRRGRQLGVTVFADADFRGRSETLRDDDPDLSNNRIRQDTISSVEVAPGCRAVLFADVGFRGASTVITGGAGDLRYSSVGNDRASSIQVDCRRR